MKAKGKKFLLVTGTLEIILGLVSILGIVSLLIAKNNGVEVTQNEAVRALGNLLVLYAIYGLHILGGLLGVIFADKPKHSSILMLFGFLLILMQIYSWTCVEMNTMDVIIEAILLLIPCYYFYGAVLNYRSPMEVEKPVRRRTQNTSVKTASSKKVVPTATKKTTVKKVAKKPTTKKQVTTKTKTTKETPKKKAVKKASTKAAKKPTTTKTVAAKKTAPKKSATAKTAKVTPKKTVAKKTATKTTKKPTTKKTTKKK